jgi:hypothetical protein
MQNAICAYARTDIGSRIAGILPVAQTMNTTPVCTMKLKVGEEPSRSYRVEHSVPELHTKIL